MSMPPPSVSTQVRSRSTRALTIDPDKIIYDNPKVELGGGTFGTVYKSKPNSFPGGLTVAVKVLKTRQFTPAEREKAWKSLLKEARAMKNVSHHNLCKFHGLSSNVNKQLLVMEYIDGDSLHHYMHLDHAIQISEKSKFGMAKQIAEGLEYLHCVAKLVHGDICPNNIMVTRDGKQTIKIVDFGLARSIEGASCSLSTSRNGRVNVRYQAPELGEENAKENFQTDVYAFGGVLNYIWTKENPWSQVKTGRQIERLILAGQTPLVSDHSILNVAPRLKLCWANDPNARPSISECKEEISRRYHSIEGVSAVEYCHQHNLPANEGDRFCYRLLRFHENPNQHDGLHAKKTNGTCSVLQHVQNGSKPSFEGSSYISITKNLRWVLWYGLKRIIEKPYKNEEPNGYFQKVC